MLLPFLLLAVSLLPHVRVSSGNQTHVSQPSFQAGRPDFATMTPVHVGYELAAKDFLEDVADEKVNPWFHFHAVFRLVFLAV